MPCCYLFRCCCGYFLVPKDPPVNQLHCLLSLSLSPFFTHSLTVSSFLSLSLSSPLLFSALSLCVSISLSLSLSPPPLSLSLSLSLSRSLSLTHTHTHTHTHTD